MKTVPVLTPPLSSRSIDNSISDHGGSTLHVNLASVSDHKELKPDQDPYGNILLVNIPSESNHKEFNSLQELTVPSIEDVTVSSGLLAVCYT